MIFASDNWAGAHPAILAALGAANDDLAPAYGGDALTRRVEEKFSALFERDVAVFFVATGGAANALGLSVLTPPYGAVLAHEEAHIQMDECGAPEFYTGGAKIVPLKGFAAKLDPATVAAALKAMPERPPHGCPPKVLSITQATECGAVYSVAETKAVAEAARAAGLKTHMDGARFANALAHLGVSPAEATWRAGVDVLSFGGTKNGCLAAEAVVFFNRDDVGDFAFRRKRGGHLWSKSRYLAAQFDAYLEDGLWLRLARHANACAARLGAGLSGIDGCKVWYPVDANAVFASFSAGADDHLPAEGAKFYPWIAPGDPADGTMRRLVCSWATHEDDVDRFLDHVRRLSRAGEVR